MMFLENNPSETAVGAWHMTIFFSLGCHTKTKLELRQFSKSVIKFPENDIIYLAVITYTILKQYTRQTLTFDTFKATKC